jgi:hypothetical protein
MAEGELEDLEMKDLAERYPEYDDKNYEDLLSDFQELTKRRERRIKYSSLDTTDIDSEIKYVESLMEKRSSGQQSTPFTSGDDGKTVTITGPSGSTTVPSVDPVEDPNNLLPKVLRSVFNDSFDVNYYDMEYRLRKLTEFSDDLDTAEKKRDFENQEERVHAVAIVVQLKEKIVFNPISKNVEELIRRSSVRTLIDGTEVLMFRSEQGINKSGNQIMKRGRTSIPTYSKNSTALREYKELVKKIKEEPSTSTQTHTNKAFEGDDEGSAQQLTTSQSYEKIELDNFPMIDTKIEQPLIQDLTEEEKRELEGVLNPPDSMDQQSRIGDNRSLQIQANHFQETIDKIMDDMFRETDSIKIEWLGKRLAALKEARDLTLGQRQIEEVRAQQEEDVSRLQRFKEWAKENMLGLSAIAITVAGIITTVVIGARNVIVKGAQATGKFAKALAKLGKELGPVLGQLFNMIAKLVSLGAKGQAWLASNLWVLAIAVAWLIYDYSKERRRKK